ncbi:hypothetical protein GCK72_010245 [Caenorhabditis remanei]|uniref:Homeobox domain-containing protein n=1 Tax=Caenorhabditis remanei TaxID=31234 RepID=A0A6A5H4P3_CAERE|nr:hypothetical protein GCK72_010245 [Caenorhabditis remanei]KAF1761985.1 hypothetical protein GCK72_010245 [Caenorhabditis remanei]
MNEQNREREMKISDETSELLRIEFQFEHTLSEQRKLALASKYQLSPEQVANFFKFDMKDQRETEAREMGKRTIPISVSSDVVHDIPKKRRPRGMWVMSSNPYPFVMPPRIVQKMNPASKAAASSSGVLSSASSSTTASSSKKNKISKTLANQTLTFEFNQNSKLPESRKKELAERLGLSPEEVRRFFVNARMRGIRAIVGQVRVPKFKF